MQDTVRNVIDKALEYPRFVLTGGANKSYGHYSEKQSITLLSKIGAVATLSLILSHFSPLPKVFVVCTTVFYTAVHDLYKNNQDEYQEQSYFTSFCIKIAKGIKQPDDPKKKFQNAVRMVMLRRPK